VEIVPDIKIIIIKVIW